MMSAADRGYRPDVAIPPGETIREAMEARGLNQAELSSRLDKLNEFTGRESGLEQRRAGDHVVRAVCFGQGAQGAHVFLFSLTTLTWLLDQIPGCRRGMGVHVGGGHSVAKEQRERIGRPGCGILDVLACEVKRNRR